MDIHGIIVLAYVIWLGLIALAILFCAADILRNQGDEPQRTLLWFTVITTEWTEGSYLEPDARYGYGMLEAVKECKAGLPG